MALKTNIALFRDQRLPDAPYVVSWSEVDSFSHRPLSPRLTARLQAQSYTAAVIEAARVLVMSPGQVGEGWVIFSCRGRPRIALRLL